MGPDLSHSNMQPLPTPQSASTPPYQSDSILHHANVASVLPRLQFVHEAVICLPVHSLWFHIFLLVIGPAKSFSYFIGAALGALECGIAL